MTQLVFVTNQLDHGTRCTITLARGIDFQNAGITTAALVLSTLAVLGRNSIEQLLSNLTMRTTALHTTLTTIFLRRLGRKVSEDSSLVVQFLNIITSFVSLLRISYDLVNERRELFGTGLGGHDTTVLEQRLRHVP